MNRLTHKIKNAELRRNRVRAKVSGTAKRPRLSVHISNRHIIGQLINDETASTLVYVSTVGKKEVPAKMTEKAAWVGQKSPRPLKPRRYPVLSSIEAAIYITVGLKFWLIMHELTDWSFNGFKIKTQ